MSGYPCPYCENKPLDSVATLPYVRGFLLAYQIGTKRFIGCRPCVRKQIFKEVGLSSVVGWFSVTALFINPFFIGYGLIRGTFLQPDVSAVRKQLREAGIPEEPTRIDVLQVAYAMAATMITADGKVEQGEVQVAVELGQRLFAGFDGNALVHQVNNFKQLPEVSELSALLTNVLDDGGKRALYEYLQAIAGADGSVDPAEQTLLQVVAGRFWPQPVAPSWGPTPR